MTIIVPTDFSQNAHYAAEYACQLAVAKGYEIHLLHCYTTASVAVNEIGDQQDQSLQADQMIQEQRTKLQANYPGLFIGTACYRSLIVEKLSELSKQPEFGMIVMGASGESQLKSVYYGSTTMAVASKSEIPVLVIPNQQTAYRNKNIALLTNFKPEELDTLKEYMHLIGNIDSLTLIHVFRENQKPQNVQDTLASWAFNIREMMPIEDIDTVYEPIHKEEEGLDTVAEVVSKLIEHINADLVLVTPSRKTFFERLFRSSVSKSIALELTKPAFFDKI